MAEPVAVLVAPYAPGELAPHLGAAKKIELVLGLVRRLGFAVHLVDSSHPRLALAGPVLAERRRLGGADVTLWRPFSLPSRKVGKLANVYFSGTLFHRLAALDPALVWLYNSYAFEARLGLHLRRRTACRLVLELEDLPLARGRGLNPKPFLDQLYFGELLERADLTTFVNAALRERFAPRLRGQSLLFPSILGADITSPAPRARFGSAPHRLGYFGGLEPDKGVRVLLDALPRLPRGWRVEVTGAGTLERDIAAAAARNPDKLVFHGRVSNARVADLMHACDAIVNPHASIAAMHDGVFPFKVCESLASGALVISTPLPRIDVGLERAVLFFDGSAAGLCSALEAAPARYHSERAEIAAVRQTICDRFGEDAMLHALRSALAAPAGAAAA